MEWDWVIQSDSCAVVPAEMALPMQEALAVVRFQVRNWRVRIPYHRSLGRACGRLGLCDLGEEES